MFFFEYLEYFSGHQKNPNFTYFQNLFLSQRSKGKFSALTKISKPLTLRFSYNGAQVDIRQPKAVIGECQLELLFEYSANQ